MLSILCVSTFEISLLGSGEVVTTVNYTIYVETQKCLNLFKVGKSKQAWPCCKDQTIAKDFKLHEKEEKDWKTRTTMDRLWIRKLRLLEMEVGSPQPRTRTLANLQPEGQAHTICDVRGTYSRYQWFRISTVLSAVQRRNIETHKTTALPVTLYGCETWSFTRSNTDRRCLRQSAAENTWPWERERD
jgi:hypothetical protein